MNKHTPGPWKIVDDDMDYIVITDIEQGFGVCRIEEVASENRFSMKANARLIAAAPEMLEALKQIAHVYKENQPASKWAVDAIAKATGEK